MLTAAATASSPSAPLLRRARATPLPNRRSGSPSTSLVLARRSSDTPLVRGGNGAMIRKKGLVASVSACCSTIADGRWRAKDGLCSLCSFLGIRRRLVTMTSINRDKRGSDGSYCLENAFQETWVGDESDKSLRQVDGFSKTGIQLMVPVIGQCGLYVHFGQQRGEGRRRATAWHCMQLCLRMPTRGHRCGRPCRWLLARPRASSPRAAGEWWHGCMCHCRPVCLLLSHVMLSIGLTWRLVRGCSMHTMMRLL